MKYSILALASLAISTAALSQNVLHPNSYLQNGQYIISSQGGYMMIMQTDGSLVMYRRDGSIRYRMKKHGRFALMHANGNFQQLTSGWQTMWETRTAGNPGSFLAIQDDGNLVVYSPEGRPLWNIGAERGVIDPLTNGDIVGRDLLVPGLGPLGHLGVWDGSRVIEAGPNGPDGNGIHLTSFADFKAASAYWGKATPAVAEGIVSWCTTPYCSTTRWGGYVNSRKAIGVRAYQVYLLGADYTISPYFRRAWPGTEISHPQRGVYRCDTFAYDALTFSTMYAYELSAPQKAWRAYVDKIFSSAITPRYLFDMVRNSK